MDYSQYVFKQPDVRAKVDGVWQTTPGFYYTLVNGTARKLADQAQAAQMFPNAQEKSFGVDTNGYDSQHGGGTTGGTWTLDNFKNTADTLANQGKDNPSPVTPYTNPNTIQSSPSSASPTVGMTTPEFADWFKQKNGRAPTQIELQSFVYSRGQAGSTGGGDTTGTGGNGTQNGGGGGAGSGTGDTTGNTGNAGNTGASGVSPATFAGMPGDIINSPEWGLLTDNQKALAYFTWKAQTATNEASKEDAQKALEQAKQFADPYFKEQIRMAQDSIQRSVTSTSADMTNNIDRLNQRIKEISSDLSFNKDQLSLDQQAELAKQLRDNQQSLFQLQQGAAEAGLAFSSPRQEAENRLLAQQQDIAQSTSRKYAQQFRAFDLGASRDTTTLQQNIADTQRHGQEQLTDIQRKGESVLGTSDTPAVPGVAPLGDVTGTLNEQQQQQVLSLQNILEKRQDPFSSSFSS